MNGIASRLDRFEESASARASQIARDLAAAGRDILRLTTGEPDFPTPEHVKRAATEAMRREETKYTNVSGTPALKQAVAAKFRRENGLAYTTDQILVGAGAKQVIFNAMMATLEPGDEVLVSRPYYVSYHDIVRLAEGTPVLVACPSANGFRMRAEDLAAAITPRTRWLILNSPANPTGAVYSDAELKAFAAVLAPHPRVWVLSDDIYEHILFDGAKFATFAQSAPAMFERTLTVNGVSKAYAMTGWRIGYGGGPQHLIKAMAKVQSQVTHAPSSIGQAAAIAALEGPQDLVAERSHLFDSRHLGAPAAGRVLYVSVLRGRDRPPHSRGTGHRKRQGFRALPALRRRRGGHGRRGLRLVALLAHLDRFVDRGAGRSVHAHRTGVRGAKVERLNIRTTISRRSPRIRADKIQNRPLAEVKSFEPICVHLRLSAAPNCF